MKRIAMLIGVLAMASGPVSAKALYKCYDPVKEKTAYQTKPCDEAKVAKSVDVKERSPEEEAAAVRRLQEFNARMAEEEAIKAKLAKEQWEADLRAAEVEAAQRSASAQYEQAEAQRRQAEAINNLNQQVLRPIIVTH